MKTICIMCPMGCPLEIEKVNTKVDKSIDISFAKSIDIKIGKTNKTNIVNKSGEEDMQVDGKIVVTGNSCKRGVEYGISEFLHPMRSITCLVKLQGGGVCSVKTSAAVPKEKIFEVLEHLKSLTAKIDAKIGDVLEKNTIGLGVGIIVTGIPN